ncbi:hypothetical protein B0H66DRAFT_61913 [Apodospora peruviana]|uniref:C3H1-type domain-containing protein n=1 Tax=Apodospora peruviana TaxID=516989 RepID=A0AAE0ISK0_9PEZI|nr:hypothetical protein B0H66DRAFT_61913 [Apodospora peruviana]
MSYHYGPPPQAPPPAPAQAPAPPPVGYGQYGSAPQAYGQPARDNYNRPRGGGGGGGDRSYHQPPAPYGYPQPAYGQPAPAYPPQQQTAYQQPSAPQPHWHQEHVPQTGSPAPLPAHNYHPNYAPQIYQPAQQYAGQPTYAPSHPPYAGYAPTPPAPAQTWNHQPPVSHTHGGGGRGGRGGYGGDRGGKGPMMGPPIRIGFDGNSQAHQPPVAPYHPPYGAAQGPPAGYTPALQPQYGAPAAYVPTGPAQYEQGAQPYRPHRGGYSGKHRGQYGGSDKARHRAPHGPATQGPPLQNGKHDASSAAKKKKRKTNTLGMTPGDESDDDFRGDDEKHLEDLYGADAPNPIGSAEIAEWIAERRTKYPTKAKVEAKAKADAKATPALGKDAVTVSADEEKLEELEQRARDLRASIDLAASIKRKREQQDEGDEMRAAEPSSPSSSKSDEEKPEVRSSRPETGVPPPTKKADPQKHCKYYSTGGTCGKRGKCRFVHDPAVRAAAEREREANGGRMTLRQRLILNDKNQEDLSLLEAIDKLDRKVSKWRKSPGATVTASVQSAPSAAPPAPIKREPVPGLPNIPPAPATAPQSDLYKDWNLSGFGNTGVRPSDV